MERKAGKYLKQALVILAVLAGIFSVRPAGAADRLVPAQYATIQAAITAAAHYDTIIVAPGTYNENISFNGKNLTLRSTDPDDPNIVAATIIQGTGTTSVVKFTNKENSSCLLAGFTITGGAGATNGGGIAGNSTDTYPTISHLRRGRHLGLQGQNQPVCHRRQHRGLRWGDRRLQRPHSELPHL